MLPTIQALNALVNEYFDEKLAMFNRLRNNLYARKQSKVGSVISHCTSTSAVDDFRPVYGIDEVAEWPTA